MTSEYYDRIYKESNEYKKSPVNSVYYLLWKKIEEITTNDEYIFEVGCGPGQLANVLLNAGRNYLMGWDFSFEAIRMAKENNKSHFLKFMVKDIADFIPFNNRDTVICTEVLEHLEDDLFLIGLLDHGSRFIFSVPNFMIKSHERSFNNLNEIKERYSDLIINDCFMFSVGKNKEIYLIDSVKK